MLKYLLLFMLSFTATGHNRQPLNFKSDGTFKLLHISDVHYEYSDNPNCNDVTEPKYCSRKNTTDFLNRVYQLEKPDLVVHTGDIVDWASTPATKAMDEVYGVAINNNLKWVASLGNHDGQADLTRQEVMDYIVSLNNTLTQLGPYNDLHTWGNYYLEIKHNNITKFRTYHLSSNTNSVSINKEQVAWYNYTARFLNSLTSAPALTFFHIPLQEYQTAINLNQSKLIGTQNEKICYQPINSGLFNVLHQVNDTVATFCGHDHTNDFCINYQGIYLCYEGSPGYQAYGRIGWNRRVRVTEIRNFGDTVVSWKRLDNDSIVDTYTLYSKNNN